MNVQFDDNSFGQRNYAAMGFGDAPKGITGWLMKKGIAKTPAGANKIQLLASVLFFGLSIYFFIS